MKRIETKLQKKKKFLDLADVIDLELGNSFGLELGFGWKPKLNAEIT